MSFSVGCRSGLDSEWPWLWCKPAAEAPIQPLAWDVPYAAGAYPPPQKKDSVFISLASIITGDKVKMLFTHPRFQPLTPVQLL